MTPSTGVAERDSLTLNAMRAPCGKLTDLGSGPAGSMRDEAWDVYFRLLYQTYRDRLLFCAYTLTKESADAEDLVQDLFARLPQLLGHKRAGGRVLGYLTGCLRKMAAGARRTNHRRASLIEAHTYVRPASPEHKWLNAILVESLLNRLSRPDAELLAQRYLASSSTRDLADSLGINERAAQKRVERALHRARKIAAPTTDTSPEALAHSDMAQEQRHTIAGSRADRHP